MKVQYRVLFILVAGLFGCMNQEPLVVQPASSTQYQLTDFTSAQVCSTCHPQYYAEWKTSMHRFCTDDEIWRLANNALQASTNGRLDKACFQCHAPVGFLTGNTKPTFQSSELNQFVKEGVTCDFCHVLRPPYLTTDQHVRYNLQPGITKYGILSSPIPTTGHANGYDASYDRSVACKPCHDLIENHVPVEITVTEWQNSAWGAMAVECQQCHMPTYTGRAAPDAPVRTNLHRHDFVGVDLVNADVPGRTEQRAVIDSILKNSVSMFFESPARTSLGDSTRISVRVVNDKTGHNVPTSVFFFRQMWIEVTVWNGADTLYRSGHLDANGDLMNEYSAFRPNEDENLTLFSGTLYKDGKESNVVEMDSLVNNSLAPFASHTAYYGFKIPRAGPWNVRARLLFRPFGPYLFRALGADQYLGGLRIYEMARSETIIDVR